MNLARRLMSGLVLGLKGFREGYLTASASEGAGEWGDADARLTRYDILWAYASGDAYRNIHRWARPYKDSFGVYRWARDLYNPASSLSALYKTYVWGGWLDPLASDDLQSALPIQTENERLRVAIAELWKNSNWTTERNVIPFMGATLGDAFITVDDDPTRGIVRLRNVPAQRVLSLDKDNYGNVRGYVIGYLRDDDINPDTEVRYKEVVTRDGDNVVYRTYKDDSPYAWDNEFSEWEQPYGFVPFVHIMHDNNGLDWGFAELQPKLALAREADHVASLLGDKIAQQVNAPILFSGMQRPTNAPSTRYEAAPDAGQDTGRDNVPALYSQNSDSKAQFLVADLPLAEALEVLKNHISSLEQFYPELQVGKDVEGGVRSGEAERERHQAAENKIQMRRGNYDAGLIKAQQMAVSIGGWRGYTGFEGFNLDSYERGDLDHTIAYRDVFRRDDRTSIALAKSLAEVVKIYVDSGAPLGGAAKAAGMTEEEVKQLVQMTDLDFGVTQ